MHHLRATNVTLTSDSKEPLLPLDVTSSAVVPPSSSAAVDSSPPELSALSGTESMRSNVWQALQTRKGGVYRQKDTGTKHPECH